MKERVKRNVTAPQFGVLYRPNASPGRLAHCSRDSGNRMDNHVEGGRSVVDLFLRPVPLERQANAIIRYHREGAVR